MKSNKTLAFNSENRFFIAQAIPDNTGIRIMEKTNGKLTCVAMIVDNDKEFFLTSKRSKANGIFIRSFMPTVQLLLKDGTEPPLDEDQLEVYTPFGKKMVVRPLCKDNPGSGVIIAYEEDACLWSVAMCGAPEDGLVISLAE